MEVEIIATMIDDTTGSMAILVVGRRRLILEGTAWCQDGEPQFMFGNVGTLNPNIQQTGYSMAKVELELQDDEVFDEETPERSSAELLMTMVGKWIELARPGNRKIVVVNLWIRICLSRLLFFRYTSHRK